MNSTDRPHLCQERAGLILWGGDSHLESLLSRMGERVGFQLVRINSSEEVKTASIQFETLIALLYVSNDTKVLPLFPNLKTTVLRLNSRSSVNEVIQRVEEVISDRIPKRLQELVGNSVKSMATGFLGSEINSISRHHPFESSFSRFVTCAAGAEGFSMTATCEANFVNLRQSYKSLAKKTDEQLIDLFGEYCNLVLGVINTGLRPSGLDGRVFLPSNGLLDSRGHVITDKFAPLIRFVDRNETLGMTITIHVQPDCRANWDKVQPDAKGGSVEFF